MFPRLRKALGVDHYWTSPSGLTALLVTLALLVFVVIPLESSGLIGRMWVFVVDMWMAGVILAGAAALGWHKLRRGLVISGVVLLAITLGVRLLARGLPNRWTEAVSTALSLVVVSLLVVLILAMVFRQGPASRDRIFGAVAAYLLLSLDWALGYRFIDVLDPGTFRGLSWAPGAHNFSDFVYFSISTLTTVGYGDIVPLSLPARSLTSLESLVGQLFPAILLARLVSLSLQLSPKE
ncbi:MAG: potassium channel family protein [Myxococcaceae bacterium]